MNFVVHSSYNLTLEEQKIILYLANMIKVEDESFKSYKFKISDFKNLLEIKDEGQVIQLIKNLMKKVFEIEKDNKWIQIAWLSSVVYDKNLGCIELEFSSQLKTYILEFNKMFTQYKSVGILKMKSKYSPKIYELLKYNESKKCIEISITELRHLLNVEDIYPLYADFKRKIIIQTQKELEKLSDIRFDFEEIKVLRKVVSIKFYIYSNRETDKEKLRNNLIDINKINQLKSFIEEPIEVKDLGTILEVAKGDIDLIKTKYNIAKQQIHINNLTAWLISAIKNDYVEPVELKSNKPFIATPKVNRFVNYEQDNWDFEKLEKLERERINRNLSK